jgi:hypothetical protein
VPLRGDHEELVAAHRPIHSCPRRLRAVSPLPAHFSNRRGIASICSNVFLS